MPIRWIQPRALAKYLKAELDNGHYRLTWKEIAMGIFEIESAEATNTAIKRIRWVWNRAEKLLRKRGTCAILVTKYYFDEFERREPENEQAVRMCIALDGRKAAGVRLLCMKGMRNDPMAIMYIRIRTRNVQGGQSAILDRIAIEYERGKLTPALARKLVAVTTKPALPGHEAAFAKLMGVKNHSLK